MVAGPWGQILGTFREAANSGFSKHFCEKPDIREKRDFRGVQEKQHIREKQQLLDFEEFRKDGTCERNVTFERFRGYPEIQENHEIPEKCN